MKTSKLLYALLFAVAVPHFASAESIKVPLGDDGSPDVSFDGSVFGTVDDGDASTLGDQNTRILFAGFGGMFSDDLDGDASFSLDGVVANGAASSALPGVVAQGTTGGTFNLYSANNTLLLSGTLTDGALTGSTNASSGSFFNTVIGNFTGGALLSYFDLHSLNISLAMTDILSGGVVGMHITNGSLDPFNADASGLITGSAPAAVPEPASMLLLLSGCSAAFAARKKQKAA